MYVRWKWDMKKKIFVDENEDIQVINEKKYF